MVIAMEVYRPFQGIFWVEGRREDLPLEAFVMGEEKFHEGGA